MNRTVLHCDSRLVVRASSCRRMEVHIPAKHLVEHHTNKPPVACLGVLGAAILGLENLQQTVHGITRCSTNKANTPTSGETWPSRVEKFKFCVVMQPCSSNTWSSDGICGIEHVSVVINARACAKVSNLNKNAKSGAYCVIQA